MFDKKVIDVIRFEEKKMMDEFLYQSWPDICVRKSDGLWLGRGVGRGEGCQAGKTCPLPWAHPINTHI